MPTPPRARRSPINRTMFGETVEDAYGWLRDRDHPDTLPYLVAENTHTEDATAHLAELKAAIFEEISARTQQTDISAPAKWGDWWYATRTDEGSQYPIFVRMRGAPDGPEQVMVDANRLAEGHDHLRIGLLSVSPDQRLSAYSVDHDGSETFTMRIRDLTTGEDLPDEIRNTYYSAAWSADSSVLFYTTIDEAHRPDRVWRHVLGTDASEDRVAFEEPDHRMYLEVSTTTDRSYVLISAGSQVTADVHFVAASRPFDEFQPVLPRVHGVQYSVDHQDGRWLIVTDRDAPNGRLMSMPVGSGDDATTVIEHDPLRKVGSVKAFASHAVVSGRVDGLTSLTILRDTRPERLEFDEPVYTVALGPNHEYDTHTLRIRYESLTTPKQIVDIDLSTGARTVVKEQPVLGGYDRDAYQSERLWARADDGALVPIALVRRRDVDLPAPMVLYGYGSYEATVDPYFSIPRLSLLERGVAFAIAEPRGSGAMGRLWYEEGKLANKMRTFTDFLAAASHLIARGDTTPDMLAIRGGSAGGLLMGAATNLRPDLFRAVVAEVPFVDVVNTMLDETLPLTVIEWEEWGNPALEDQYGWLRAYAPYENLDPSRPYPAMFVTAGLNDPRVAYWEPAKWVAAMRDTVTNRGPLLLKTELGAGHGGKSGRYDAWRDEAEVLAFVLDQIRPG